MAEESVAPASDDAALFARLGKDLSDDSWDATLAALKEQIAATRNTARAPVQEVDRG